MLACVRPPDCAVHRMRNLTGEGARTERERVRQAESQALDESTHERDGKQRLQARVAQLDKAGCAAAAGCLADDLHAAAPQGKRYDAHEQTIREEVTAALADHHREPEPRRSYRPSGTRRSGQDLCRSSGTGIISSFRNMRQACHER